MQKAMLWIGCIVAAALFIGLSYNLTHQPDGGAAWVQAIGSVGAIVGAVWINWSQHQKALERKQQEDRANARKLITILKSLNGSVRVTAQEAADRLEDRNRGETSQHRIQALRSMEQLKHAFSELPLASMPDEEVAQLLLDVRWNANIGYAVASQFAKSSQNIGGGPGKGTHWRFVERSAEQAQQLIDAAFTRYEN